MARRPTTPRAARRSQRRTANKLRDDLERLARLEPGGTPEHPIEISSPVQVDARATTTPCPICDGRLELDEHTAERIDGERLRVARCHCTACGTTRALFFRLVSSLQS